MFTFGAHLESKEPLSLVAWNVEFKGTIFKGADFEDGFASIFV